MSTQVHHHDIEEAARRRTSNLIFTSSSQELHPLQGSSSGGGGAAASSNHHAPQDPLSCSITRFEPPPPSRGVTGLPLTTKHLQSDPSSSAAELRLLHPILNKVPLQFRFGFNGLLSNVLFMVAYNASIVRFSHWYRASTIYSVVYLLFIPVSHVLVSLLVFGWPSRYLPSLMSNFPIGLTALALGSLLTAYLDSIDFNYRIEEYIRDNYSFSKMPARPDEKKQEEDEFYSSILVLAVTSVWTYVLSVYINAPSTTSEKKEL
jgi:hypothetical protein